jgi:exosome complex component RRP45
MLLTGQAFVQVLDPSLKEELVMGGRLTITVNTHGEVCGVQKGGGVGVSASELMRCLRLASTKAAVLTETLKKVVSFCHPGLSNSVCNKHFPLLRLFC